MNRRKALKNLVVASGALITLPSWMGNAGNETPVTHLSSFSTTGQEMLASIADTFIPPGNAVGALSVGVDKFLQKMIDDCYEKDVQDNVKTQLKALDASANKIHGKPFSQCGQAQRQELLLAFSASANKAEKDFFSLMRSETIRGFNTSQEVLQKYLHYTVAPGHYYGCVDLKS